MDPAAVLVSVTAAVSLLGNEAMKGVASEAGKSAWAGIKKLLGWSSDPPPAEIAQRVEEQVSASPDIVAKLLELLKSSQNKDVSQLVGKIEAQGGKIVVAQSIVTDHFQM